MYKNLKYMNFILKYFVELEIFSDLWYFVQKNEECKPSHANKILQKFIQVTALNFYLK